MPPIYMSWGNGHFGSPVTLSEAGGYKKVWLARVTPPSGVCSCFQPALSSQAISHSLIKLTLSSAGFCSHFLHPVCCLIWSDSYVTSVFIEMPHPTPWTHHFLTASIALAFNSFGLM